MHQRRADHVTLNRHVLVALLALVAVLEPTLSAVSSEFAGWAPAHGHVYVGGIPVPHTHPWDADTSALRGPVALAGVICYLHGAPHAVPTGDPAAPRAPEQDGDSPVVFTSEHLGLFASVVPPGPMTAPVCPQPRVVPLATVSPRLVLVAIAPIPRPPQS